MRLVSIVERYLLEELAVAVLDVHSGQRLARLGDELDADAVGAQRVRGHVVHGLLEQFVVVLVVDRRADVREHLGGGEGGEA